MPEEQVEKKKVGRPAIEDCEKRKVSCSMYLTEEEHRLFMVNIAASGMSVSNFIRSKCADAVVAAEEKGESVVQ